MAQADSVHSAVSIPLTGADAKPSTNPFWSGHQTIAGRERQLAFYLHPTPVRLKDGADCLALAALSPYSTGLDAPAPKIAGGRAA